MNVSFQGNHTPVCLFFVVFPKGELDKEYITHHNFLLPLTSNIEDDFEALVTSPDVVCSSRQSSALTNQMSDTWSEMTQMAKKKK